MEPISVFASFYPTGSSSLAQHGCVHLLWKPISAFPGLSGVHVQPPARSAYATPHSQRSLAHSFAASSGLIGGGMGSSMDTRGERDDDLVSGLEMRLRRACMHSPPIPMTTFRECFMAPSQSPAGRPPSKAPGAAPQVPPHYTATAHLRFFIGEDKGASQWENLDMHRVAHGVIVVADTTQSISKPWSQALQTVKTVFDAQYRGKVCRCFVIVNRRHATGGSAGSSGANQVNEEGDLLAGLPPRTFIPIESTADIEQTARDALVDIGRNIVFSLNATLSEYDEYMATLSQKSSNRSKLDFTSLRTPLDTVSAGVAAGGLSPRGGLTSGSPSGGLESLKTHLIISRLKKKRADVLLQLGATDMALQTYAETQFASNADPMWCSATLEAIAAVRFHQWFEKIVADLPRLSQALVGLQSEETNWQEKEKLLQLMGQLEATCGRICQGVQTTVGYLKGPCVPNSMRQRLSRNIDDALSAKATQLASLLALARTCIEEGTNDIEGSPAAYHVGTDIKLCVEEMIRVGLNEVVVYLEESFRQLRHAAAALGANGISGGGGVAVGGSGSVGGTQDKEKAFPDRTLDTHLKILSFTAIRGTAEETIQGFRTVRNHVVERFGTVSQDLLRFFAYLGVRARCRRKAIGFLMEAARNDRKEERYAATIHSLVRVCFLCGVPLGPIPELNAAVLNDPLYHLHGLLALFPTSASGVLSPVAALAQGAAAGGPHSPTSQATAEASIERSMLSTGDSIKPGSFSFFSGEELHPNHGTSKLNELALTSEAMKLHIPLVMELLDVLDEAGCRGSVRCQLASLLLFRYPSLLAAKTAERLTAIARQEALLLEPHDRPATAPIPFLSSWEALPLPAHLAPKTVSVGGPFFTFIDTERLKLTILSLNGRKLNSRVVWTVGDVGSVMVALYNPYQWQIKLRSLALQSRSCADLDDQNELPPGAESHTMGPLAPTSYTLSSVTLPPLTKTKVILQVQPNMEGFLRIEGVELRLAHLERATLPVRGLLPEPMAIPVLQQLPLVSCTVSVSELEIFSGQCIDFTVRVVNCGQLPIAHISLTAHGDACLLEDCEGCKERVSKHDVTIALNKAALEAASRAPLSPGDVVTIPVRMQAPPSIDTMDSQFIIFRVDCSLPHSKPTMPPNVPSAVPVFGVIPRRVSETRMRVFHSPTLTVTTVRLTKDKRFVDVRLMNQSEFYTVELALSSLPFARLPDALIMAGADYVVPPIDISRVADHAKGQGAGASGAGGGRFVYNVPWSVREIPNCTGMLPIDLGLISEEVVCSEPLDQVELSVDFKLSSPRLDLSGSGPTLVRHWELRRSMLGNDRRGGHHSHHRGSRDIVPNNSIHTFRTRPQSASDESQCSSVATSARQRRNSRQGPDRDADEDSDSIMRGWSSSSPIVLPAVRPIQVRVRATADWRRAVPLSIHADMSNHLDVGVLSGPVHSMAAVGDGGRRACELEFELLAFKTGEHELVFTIKDSGDREIVHVLPFVVEHDHDRD